MILAAVGLPVLLAYILVAADMRPDLSDLRPVRSLQDSSLALIGWPDLPLRAPTNPSLRVRMLGYMMDGYRSSPDGTTVNMFILMPEAGQLFHPAHRVPDQMVEIWLTSPVTFRDRSLVWVSGVLWRTTAPAKSNRAGYAIKEANVEPASDSDIALWFRP
jgi:hypothetical protein